MDDSDRRIVQELAKAEPDLSRFSEQELVAQLGVFMRLLKDTASQLKEMLERPVVDEGEGPE